MNPLTDPPWAKGLKKYGNYYEGMVENAHLTLELHKVDTVTTFGIRRTEKPRSAIPAKDKENVNPESLKPKVIYVFVLVFTIYF